MLINRDIISGIVFYICNEESVINNCNKYNPKSPLLCGEIMEGDKINRRKVRTIKV